MTNNNNEERTLDLPGDIGLPFFAYGIFKPGQLAYSKIRNHVDEEKIINVEINYKMKHRDGVPILMEPECEYCCTNGFILPFKEGQENTYEIVSKTFLRKLYEWKTIQIDGKDVNVLFGVDPDNGSDDIEFPEERVNFDGENDPFFSDVLELIEKNKDSNRSLEPMERFFELQMNYMLLWSAIDRFSSLKYNRENKNDNFERFAKQKAFKDGIKRYRDAYHRPVYSTDDLMVHKFNAENPIETMYYYYTLRCNVVHRGKSMRTDYILLKTATEELLEIFKDVLKISFDKSWLLDVCKEDING